jgi:hypothetical protein
MAETILGSALDFAIEEALRKMSADEREHFKMLCGALLACYTSSSLHSLVLIGRDEYDSSGMELAQIISVNSSDIQAAQLMAAAQTQISTLVMAEAPPREKFN